MSRFFSGGRLVVLAVVMILFFFVAVPVMSVFSQAAIMKPYLIPSGSMQPTIQPADRLLANRLIYHFTDIERGDIIAFDPPTAVRAGAPYIKRVIGLPGDTVEIRNGMVLVNGEELVVEGASKPTYTKPLERVPEDKLFVLGDNRNESSDSHIWGFVPVDNVVGRIDLVYWPPANMHRLD